jgi:DMSO reductase anchor subunit
MSAFLVLNFLVRLWQPRAPGMAVAVAVLVVVAWCLKEAYWRSIGMTSAPSTVASATLLGSRGKVRMLEPPHTEENYLLKEMGFAIARKHRARLRAIVRLAGFVLPALLTLLPLVVGGVIGVVAAGLAVVGAALGLVAERWLFFAEAKHTVMLYYGAEAV